MVVSPRPDSQAGLPAPAGGEPSLCQPGEGLSCFACCPPIRPAGYDHADHRGPLRRQLSDNRAAWRKGELPQRAMVGFSCAGLGFLDAAGRTAGCLLHPLNNQGQDLRGATGYAAKCARESCPEARAWAELDPHARAVLLALCQGLDVFAFGSRRLNPVMRLLAWGPVAAGAAAGLGLAGRGEMEAWAWLRSGPPAWGWFLGLAAAEAGPGLLRRSDLGERLEAAVEGLARDLGPRPPLEQGRPWRELGDEWEGRFWRACSGRARLDGEGLDRWQALALARAAQVA